jgi:hypothetical protein
MDVPLEINNKTDKQIPTTTAPHLEALNGF